MEVLDTLDQPLIEHLAERLRVLGDATRLSILRTLLLEGPLTVGGIVTRVGSSQANVSKHLRILHTSGIVHRRAEGTAAYYSVEDPSVIQICDIVCARIRTQAEAEARRLNILEPQGVTR